MAYIQYLTFEGEKLPLPDSYDISMDDVEADSSGETEAGTRQRDVIRAGVHTIEVAFSVSPTWLKKLTVYKQMPRIHVAFFDTETLDIHQAEMYVDGFKTKLRKDTSYKGLWTVSFTLKEY